MTVVFFATAEKSSVVAFSYHRPSKQATISILEIVPHANPSRYPNTSSAVANSGSPGV